MSLNGHYLLCEHCQAYIREDWQYEFLDIREDPMGRDVITFNCKVCGKQSESFAYLESS